MGLLAKITQRVAPLAAKFGGFIPGIGPVVSKAGALLSRVPAGKVAGVVAAGGAFGAAESLGQRVAGVRTPTPGEQLARMWGRSPGYKKKKRHGLSASDIRGAQKVARLVRAFGYKPKIKPRRKGGR